MAMSLAKFLMNIIFFKQRKDKDYSRHLQKRWIWQRRFLPFFSFTLK